MAKSLRTAFIRVTNENETEQGLVIYTFADWVETLKFWSSRCKMTYWLIEHEADEEVSKSHVHMVIKFSSPYPFESLKAFVPYGNIDSAKSVKNCVQYLVHANDESKVQYDWDKVVTNCTDMTPYKLKSNAQQEVTIQKILEKINSGEIKEYNQFSLIPIELWSKHRSRIENALLYYRERVCMDKNREIEVVFMSGGTGIGKTTFAKMYCDGANKSYCVSSSSNDPMQDYKGEDVLILDDLRDDSYSFTDLLKILDNHTKSTVKSRYHNKSFIGDMIIITSYRPIVDWYFNITTENKEQLYRRIKSWYKFSENIIEIFNYDEFKHKYIKQGSTRNPMNLNKKEYAKIAIDMCKVMGLEFEPEVQNEIDKAMQMSVDEWERIQPSDDIDKNEN